MTEEGVYTGTDATVRARRDIEVARPLGTPNCQWVIYLDVSGRLRGPYGAASLGCRGLARGLLTCVAGRY
jgi:hypothetical protein